MRGYHDAGIIVIILDCGLLGPWSIAWWDLVSETGVWVRDFRQHDGMKDTQIDELSQARARDITKECISLSQMVFAFRTPNLKA